MNLLPVTLGNIVGAHCLSDVLTCLLIADRKAYANCPAKNHSPARFTVFDYVFMIWADGATEVLHFRARS